MRFMCAHLQLHQDELTELLKALKRMCYEVNTESGDADQWVLSCDQREATIGPLIDELLLDRQHPGLTTQPELLQSLSVSLIHAPQRLETLFEAHQPDMPETLPESAQIGQNTLTAEHRNTQEKNHAESQ